MMSFNNFFLKYKLNNKAASNIKTYQVLSSLSLSDISVYLRDGPFDSDIGLVNLHPFECTHWVLYIHENFFDSYGCAPPQKLSKYIIKLNGLCFYSEYKIQRLTNKRDSYCTRYCLYIIYLTKVISLDFQSAVFNLNYQMM